MKKELFFRYCRWLFPILESCEHRIDATYYSEDEYRVIAHLAERCLGIFYTYLFQNEVAAAVFFHRLFVRRPDVGIRPFPRSTDPVTIVTASSDHFTPYMAVMIQSILENTSSGNNYEIYILHANISKENQKKVTDLAKNYPHAYIGFYSMNMDISPFNFKPSPWTWHLTEETYFRTLIHKIFSAYKKVLYLDGDMIVKSDVADIFNIDIGGNLIGACLDGDIIGSYSSSIDSKNYIEHVLKISDPLKYFQAGVQLVNIQQFRKEFGDYELANKAVKSNYRYNEQDVFNAVCHGKVFFVDSAWNVLVQHKWDRIAIIKKAPAYIYRHYLEARKHPHIIHYAGAQKPWFDPEMDFAEDFWDVARRSPFYETILLRLCHYRPPFPQSKLLIKKIVLSLFPADSKRRNMLRRVYYRLKK
jgi:lipopolysaccharide biosynthesis glycosyltransferase